MILHLARKTPAGGMKSLSRARPPARWLVAERFDFAVFDDEASGGSLFGQMKHRIAA
ncbi:hypothetical protein [Oceanicola sp. 22II-s10i]|uniref:hypothetical protein n=1 Tax=Oceanicola sp. 22II-s10i TaxID=1317116 RepID=UPI0015959D8C|nr:hypothetical protein [Oceanicola sp. 22II-s10i]